jgi:hypothetical protein
LFSVDAVIDDSGEWSLRNQHPEVFDDDGDVGFVKDEELTETKVGKCCEDGEEGHSGGLAGVGEDDGENSAEGYGGEGVENEGDEDEVG